MMCKNKLKKIVVVNNNLHIGGVQKALINLLKCISNEYNVSLIVFNPEGEYLEEIPENVNVLPVSSSYRFLGMTKYDVKDDNLLKLQRSLFAAITRIFGREFTISIMSKGQKKIKGYDIAISYIHDGADKVFYGGCNDFVLKHIEASKKITFLHCDYGKCGADTIQNAKRYAEFDVIAACSEGCKNAFIKARPELKDKAKIVYNCHDFQQIHKKALGAIVELSKEKVNVLTVARLGKEKGVSRAIEAIANSGLSEEDFHYYIVGDGIEKGRIKELIHHYGLETEITLLGEMDNPYGYMKAADLLLIPSVSEAAPMVIHEAASLGTPILSTETSSAKEMISDMQLGWVCDNSIEGIAKSFNDLVTNRILIDEKKVKLQNMNWENKQAMVQFENLLNQE